MSRPRRRRWLLVLLIFLGLFAAAEIVVRLADLVQVDAGVRTPQQAEFNAANMFVPVDDGRVGYRNRPLARCTVDSVAYEHDKSGRRVMPAGDGIRVAFLGDSTTYGWGLPAEQSLPAAAARELGVSALNLGVNGYTTPQQAALYESSRDSLGDCPVVVLVVFPNDFTRGSFRWDERGHVLYMDALPVPDALEPLLWRSALYRGLVSWHTDRLRDEGVFGPQNRANWPAVSDAIAELAGMVRADGRALLVVHLPAMETLDPYVFEEAVAYLKGACEAMEVPFVDLLPAFLAERERLVEEHRRRAGQDPPLPNVRGFLSRYWLVDPWDHHLNAEATAIAARELAAAVEPLLPR